MERATPFQPRLTHSGILVVPLTPLLLQLPGGGGLPPLMTAGWASAVKNLPAMQEMQVHSLGGADLEEEMATCSSILVWTIPWTEEPGGLVTNSDTTEQLTTARLGPLAPPVFPVPW